MHSLRSFSSSSIFGSACEDDLIFPSSLSLLHLATKGSCLARNLACFSLSFSFCSSSRLKKVSVREARVGPYKDPSCCESAFFVGADPCGRPASGSTEQAHPSLT